MEKLGDRLEWALNTRNMNLQQLADACKVTRSAASYWLDGQTKNLKMQYLFAAAKALKVSPEWLALGSGAPEATAYRSFEEIPLVESFYHGGDGEGMEHPEEPRFLKSLSFRRDWLEYEHLEPEKLKVAMVHGKSMEPTLKEADVILVDRSEDSLQKAQSGYIYAMVYNGSPLVKRLYKQELGGCKLVSDNKRGYDDISISEEDAEKLQIIGRVVWAGGKVD